MKKIILSIAIAISSIIPVFFTNSVNAWDGWTDVNSVTLRRSYYNGQYNFVANELVGNVNIPYTIVSYGWLTGITLHSIPVSSGNFKTYTTVYIDVSLMGQNNWWQDYGEKPIRANILDQNNTWYNMTCDVIEITNNTQKVRCSYALPTDRKPSQIDFVWGNMTGNNLVPLAAATTSGIKLSYVGWGYDTSSSEEAAYLQQLANQNQTIINQNQTIINQNQEIIDSQNATNEWLQDTTPPNVDTSSLGSSVGWMPAGPVDSILTLPLQLLQGIINVFTNTNCSPLRVPVPYVNEDITLPCVSTLMDDIGFTPVWNIVGGVISAVIIWDTLKWLYRFVDDTLTFRENNSGMWGGL